MNIRSLFRALPFLVVVLCILSCNITDNDERQTYYPKPINFSAYHKDSTLIIGSWQWLRTSYYFTASGKPVTETPKSTNSTQKLVIKNDGEIEFYEDDELIKVRSVSSYLDNKLWGVLGDTLAISTAHVDGPESVYLRGD